jgi:hypothetical protein
MNRNFLTAGAAGRYTRIGLASSLFVTIAVTGMIDSVIARANAANLTQEQKALVAKYRISEADQQKLFGTQPKAAKPAQSAMPVKAPPPPPAKAVAAPVIPFLSTTYVFASLDTYKSVGERITNINGGQGALTGSFGATGGFNTGFEFGDTTIGVQGGASWGVYDFKGRIRLTPNNIEREKQTYYTAGVYRRGDMSVGSFLDRFSGAVVYDVFKANQWGVNANDISLSQVRYIAGFAVIPSTEVGVSGTVGVNDDRAAITVAGAPNLRTPIHAMRQTNVYVKHVFDFGGQVMAYYGRLSDKDIAKWQAGATAQAPLSPNWSVFANANYVVPRTPAGPIGSGQEQFSASVGIAYYFGGNAQSPTVSGSKGLPMLDVASNRTFLISP